MSDAPELLWLWPAEPEDGVDNFVSFPGQRYPSGSTTYIRADVARATDALLREAVDALGGVMTACDQGRMVATTGVGGMTIEANIRGSVYMGVPAWPIEEARTTLAKLRAHLEGETE